MIKKLLSRMIKASKLKVLLLIVFCFNQANLLMADNVEVFYYIYAETFDLYEDFDWNYYSCDKDISLVLKFKNDSIKEELFYSEETMGSISTGLFSGYTIESRSNTWGIPDVIDMNYICGDIIDDTHGYDAEWEEDTHTYGFGTKRVIVDVPVIIESITSSLSGSCIDAILDEEFTVTTTYIKDRVSDLKIEIYTTYGTWVEINNTFHGSDLVSLGFVPNEKLKIRTNSMRTHPFYPDIVINDIYEYDYGPIIYAPITGVTIDVPTVCEGETQRYDFTFTEPGIYPVSIEEEGGEGGSTSGTLTTTYANQTKSIYSDNISGTFKVTVENDACESDCAAEFFPTDPVPAKRPQLTLDYNWLPSKNISCHNSEDGEIHVAVGGIISGTSLILYNTDDGSTETKVINSDGVYFFDELKAGVYELELKNQYCNKYLDEFEDWPIEIYSPNYGELKGSAAESEMVSCHINNIGNHNDGEIEVSASGGWPGYYYYSRDIAGPYSRDSVVLSGFDEGSHEVYVKDRGGCIKPIQSDTIGLKTAELIITAENIQDEICLGDKSGRLNFERNTGLGKDTLYNSSGAFTKVSVDSVYSDLEPGTYWVRLSSGGCYAESNSITIKSSGSDISITNLQLKNVSCNPVNYDANGDFDDGEITVEASGGWGDYEYLRTEIGNNTELSYGTSNSFDGLSIGEYKFRVRDRLGCATDLIAKTVISNDPIIITTNIIDSVDCKGGNDAEVSVSIEGGVLEYSTVSIDSNTNELGSISYIDSDTIFSNLFAHSDYKVKVIDSKGCYDYSAPFEITEPNEPLAFTYSIDSVISCATGQGAYSDARISINVEDDSGWEGYKYSIEKNNGGKSNFKVDSFFHYLGRGDYEIFVLDTGGCEVSEALELVEPNALNFITAPTIKHQTCFWDNDDSGASANGSITLSAQGGNPESAPIYNFYLSYDDLLDPMDSINDVAVSEGKIFSELAPNDYYRIKVVDSKGCKLETTSEALQLKNYTNPTLLAENVTMDRVDCFADSSGSITVSEINQGVNSENNPVRLNHLFFEWINESGNNVNDSALIQRLENGPLTESSPSLMDGEETEFTQKVSANLTQATVFSNLPYRDQDYSIYAIDDSNCVSNIFSQKVAQPDSILTIDLTIIDSVDCKGAADGKLEFDFYGGWGSLLDSAKTTLYKNLNGTSNKVSDKYFYDTLAYGNYFVRVMNDSACVAYSDTLEIKEPKTPLTFTMEQVPVTCHTSDNGEHNDGEITVTANGGWEIEYKYNITEPKSIQDTIYIYDSVFTNLYYGDHYMALQDSGGCIVVDTILVNQPDSIQITQPILYHEICADTDTGKIQLSSEGSHGNFSFLLFDGDSITNTFSGIDHNEDVWFRKRYPSPNYQIEVRDDRACSNTTSIFEIIPYTNPSITENDVVLSHVRCNGQSNGSILVYGTPGDSAFHSMSFYASATNYDTVYAPLGFYNFQGLGKGVYNISVIDSMQCPSNVYVAELNQPDLPLSLAIESVSPVIHKGENSGVLKLIITGGNPGVDMVEAMAINSGAVFSSQQLPNYSFGIDSLMADSFYVAVSDTMGCVDTAYALITEPDTALSFVVTDIADALCKAKVGSFNVKGIGGWGQYEFKGATRLAYYSATTFSDLYAGDYLVTVIDSMGAEYSNRIIINEPADSLVATLFDSVAPTCSSNGRLGFEITGGTQPYWAQLNSDTLYLYENQYKTDAAWVGNYLFNIYDSNECQFNLEVELPETNLLSIKEIAVDKYVTQIEEPGNGALQAYITGGHAPVQVNWYALSDSLTSIGSNTYIDSLNSGMYHLVVQEANGCIKQEVKYLPFYYDVPLQIISITPEKSYEANNGIAILKSGMSLPTSLSLVNNEGYTQYFDSTALSLVFSKSDSIITLNNLAPQTYSVLVSNSQDECEFVSFTIGEYEYFQLASQTITPVKRKGDADGKIEIAIQGGAANKTYSWTCVSDPDFDLQPVSTDTASYIADLKTGTYLLIVEDEFGNTIEESFDVIGPEFPLSLSSTIFDALCKDSTNGYAELAALGGWGDYQFGIDTVEHLKNGATWYDLESRQYTFYVVDKFGVSDSVTINVNEPEYLNAQLAFIDHVTCKSNFDGSANFAITGGTQPYRYKHPFNEKIWNQDTLATGLLEGDYLYQFTDANNCLGTDTLALTITAPDSLLFSAIDVVHTTCNTDNGTIDVSMQGGTFPYNYVWTTMQGDTLSTDPAVTKLKQLTQYKLLVSDSNNCQNSLTQLIQASTVPVTDKLDISAVKCWGDTTGTATVLKYTEATPVAPVSFTWSNTDTGTSSNRFSQGQHYVVISDTNGCTSTKYFSVEQPNALMAQVTDKQAATCYGYNNAFVSISPSGGVGNYSISWMHGDTTFTSTDLAAGWYKYQLSDSNACSVTDSVELTQPNLLRSKVADIDSILCKGDNNGSVEFTLYGGTAPYFYKALGSDFWINDNEIKSMSEGSYTYLFRDNNNCASADTLTVNMPVPDSLLFKMLDLQHTTCDENNGAINVSMQGGVEPYVYSWTDRSREILSTTNYMDSLKQLAQYWLTVTDKNNCTFSYNVQINESNNPYIENIDVKDVLCFGGSTGTAQLSELQNAVPYAPYTVQWSNGTSGLSTDSLSVGAYSAFVLDTNGCSNESFFYVGEPDLLQAELVDSANPHCYNYTDGFINIAPIGGVGDYQAYWSNNTYGYSNSNLAHGVYHLVLSDSNNCIFEQSYVMTEPDTFFVDLGDDVEICPGTIHTLDGADFAAHYWMHDTSFISDERFVHADTQGVYSVLVTNSRGCFSSNKFELSVGNDALVADFLMTSETNLGDTLYILELSNLPLDSMHWNYDNEVFFDFTEPDDPEYLLRLKGFNTGVYNIGLDAFSGGCVATQTKQVEVIEMNDTSSTFNYVGYDPLIQELILGPNPTDGEFIARITLREEAEVQLVIYGVDFGQIIDNQKLSGFDYYEIPYNLQGKQTGMYVIIVTAENERKQSKLILR